MPAMSALISSSTSGGRGDRDHGSAALAVAVARHRGHQHPHPAPVERLQHARQGAGPRRRQPRASAYVRIISMRDFSTRSRASAAWRASSAAAPESRSFVTR